MSYKNTYNADIRPKLKEELGLKNLYQTPQVLKIVVNVGLGSRRKTDKILETVNQDLAVITGQKSAERKARKAIAGFKLRQGEVIGSAVTLRGQRMYDFLERLVRVSLPRIRDFRGLPLAGFDGKGNYSFGIKEHTVFPEVDQENARELYGIAITIVTSAQTDDQGEQLLRSFGFPLVKRETQGDE
ncbi:50S ribosomal protein L5 [Candidatus Berkelbacteria bacterium]|nr:50S ribosomal protein L5 [Candidatus Berkelbacteria bacterium]